MLNPCPVNGAEGVDIDNHGNGDLGWVEMFLLFVNQREGEMEGGGMVEEDLKGVSMVAFIFYFF